MTQQKTFTTPVFRRLYGKNFIDIYNFLETRKNPFVSLFRFFDDRYIGLTKLIGELLELDRSIGEIGVQEATTQFLNDHNIGYKIVDSSLPFIRPNNPTIVLGINHEMTIEPLVLSSLVRDKDTHMIGVKFLHKFGKNLEKFILPVLQKKYHVNKKHNGWTEMKTLFGHLTALPYMVEGMTEDEIKAMNMDTFKKSLDVLKNKGSLILFPGGGYPKHARWRKGVGQLLLDIPEELRQETEIIPVEVSSLPRKKVLRHFIFSPKKESAYLELEVTIGEPESLQSILDEIKEKNSIKLTNILRSKILSKFN